MSACCPARSATPESAAAMRHRENEKVHARDPDEAVAVAQQMIDDRLRAAFRSIVSHGRA